MPPLIRVSVDMFRLVEKMLKYRYSDKERERSNRATAMAAAGAIARRCIMHHDEIAIVGPPHDAIRAYVCLRCHGAASEPEIKDRGFAFETIPDWEIDTILDLDLERQQKGNSRMFAMGSRS